MFSAAANNTAERLAGLAAVFAAAAALATGGASAGRNTAPAPRVDAESRAARARRRRAGRLAGREPAARTRQRHAQRDAAAAATAPTSSRRRRRDDGADNYEDSAAGYFAGTGLCGGDEDDRRHAKRARRSDQGRHEPGRARPVEKRADAAADDRHAAAGRPGPRRAAGADNHSRSSQGQSAHGLAEYLQRHPRARRVDFDPVQECFTVRPPAAAATAEPQRFRGLRKLLQAACFADYDYKAAMAACPQAAGQKRRTGLARPWHGTRRGRLVHDQLRLVVNSGGSARALRAVYGPSAVLHAHVDRLLDALRAKGLEPALAEFADFYESSGVASSIDLLCRSSRHGGAVCLVEIKVGGENYFRRGNGALQAPASLRHYNNSPLHQAFLQLLFYRQMMVDHYPELRLGSSYVAQVCQDGVSFYRLPAPFEAAGAELRQCVSAAAAAAAGRGTTTATSNCRT